LGWPLSSDIQPGTDDGRRLVSLLVGSIFVRSGLPACVCGWAGAAPAKCPLAVRDWFAYTAIVSRAV
jgi:hypothetical protein